MMKLVILGSALLEFHAVFPYHRDAGKLYLNLLVFSACGSHEFF